MDAESSSLLGDARQSNGGGDVQLKEARARVRSSDVVFLHPSRG